MIIVAHKGHSANRERCGSKDAPLFAFIDFLFLFLVLLQPGEDMMTKVENENQEVDEIVESPVEWCRRMQDEAETGEEAYNYYKLAQMWMKWEKK